MVAQWLPILATMVAAMVFSTTILSQRIHRDTEWSVTRAIQLDTQLGVSESAGKAPTFPSLQFALFRRERRLLLEGTGRMMAVAYLMMNLLLGIGVLILSVADAHDLGLSTLSNPVAWELAAFSGVAVCVGGLAIADHWYTNRARRQRLEGTVSGRLALAERYLDVVPR